MRILPLVTAGLLAVSLQAQSVSTTPVGAVTITIPAGPSTTLFGAPMKAQSVFVGKVGSVSENVITINRNAFSGLNLGNSSEPFYVLFTTGAQTGRALLINANTDSTITVSINEGGASVALNSTDASVLADDVFEVIPGDTLASLFGTAGDLKITGGEYSYTADTVSLWNGARFVAYYYNTAYGYWVMSGSAANANDTYISPNIAVALALRSGRPGFGLTFVGEAQNHNLIYSHSGSAIKMFAQQFPVDVALSELTVSGGLQSGNASYLADTVSLWNGARWIAYFQHSDGRWLRNGDSVTDYSDLVLSPGQAIAILRRSSRAGGGVFLKSGRPYVDLTQVQ